MYITIETIERITVDNSLTRREWKRIPVEFCKVHETVSIYSTIKDR